MSKTTVVRWTGGMAFEASTESGHTVTLDSRPELGGQNRGPRPSELVLAGLGGCTGIDTVSILGKMRQKLTRLEVEVTGQERGDYPQSFEVISVRYHLWGDLDPGRVDRAIRLSRDRYCVVAHLVSGRARLDYAFRINEGPWQELSPEAASPEE
ncbi:MAG: OsmC family protein [Bacillota bacterium]